MNIKRTLPILWLPLIAFWTFLFAVDANMASADLERFVPLISYVITSLLLVVQLQLVLANKREGFFVKIGTVNVLLICLGVASLSVLLNLVKSIDNQISVLFIISALVINTIIAEVFSVSNKVVVDKKKAWDKTGQELEERQIQASKKSAQARDKALDYRENWRKYLNQALIDYRENEVILDEINRIKDVLEFSSYFRKQECLDPLANLKEETEEDKILYILREIK